MNKSKDEPGYNLYLGKKVILLDNKRFKLLKFIDECGSITKASERAGISYRASLNYIENLEKDLDAEIVLTQRGGKGGGGQSKLTETGKLLIKEYRKVNTILEMHIEINEIEGIISEIDIENKIMNIDLNGKMVMLPLRGDFEVGDEVLLLISPEDIFVMLEPQESSVRNVFEGNIKGMELKDQIIRLSVDIGGTTLFLDITEKSRKKLDLNLGKKIYLAFKASAIAVIKP